MRGRVTGKPALPPARGHSRGAGRTAAVCILRPRPLAGTRPRRRAPGGLASDRPPVRPLSTPPSDLALRARGGHRARRSGGRRRGLEPQQRGQTRDPRGSGACTPRGAWTPPGPAAAASRMACPLVPRAAPATRCGLGRLCPQGPEETVSGNAARGMTGTQALAPSSPQDGARAADRPPASSPACPGRGGRCDLRGGGHLLLPLGLTTWADVGERVLGAPAAHVCGKHRWPDTWCWL